MQDFKFKAGDIVKALGQVGVILDVLYSDDQESYIIKIIFARNIGMPRGFDLLESSDYRVKSSIDQWVKVGQEELEQAIQERVDYVTQEGAKLKEIINV